MEEFPQVQITVFTKSGESYNAEGLARKLKGAIFTLGQEPGSDDDSAIAALAGFDEAEEFSKSMDQDTIDDFCDEFCEAWKQVTKD